MPKKQIEVQHSISDFEFHIAPTLIQFHQTLPKNYVLSLQKDLQVLGQINQTIEHSPKYIFKNQQIITFKVFNQNQANYQWTLYEVLPHNHQAYLLSVPISLNNRCQAYLQQFRQKYKKYIHTLKQRDKQIPSSIWGHIAKTFKSNSFNGTSTINSLKASIHFIVTISSTLDKDYEKYLSSKKKNRPDSRVKSSIQQDSERKDFSLSPSKVVENIQDKENVLSSLKEKQGIKKTEENQKKRKNEEKKKKQEEKKKKEEEKPQDLEDKFIKKKSQCDNMHENDSDIRIQGLEEFSDENSLRNGGELQQVNFNSKNRTSDDLRGFEIEQNMKLWMEEKPIQVSQQKEKLMEEEINEGKEFKVLKKDSAALSEIQEASVQGSNTNRNRDQDEKLKPIVQQLALQSEQHEMVEERETKRRNSYSEIREQLPMMKQKTLTPTNKKQFNFNLDVKKEKQIEKNKMNINKVLGAIIMVILFVLMIVALTEKNTNRKSRRK